MGDVALNFSRSEFRCSHCGRLVGPTAELLAVLQRARTAKGEPLRIVSGYRCRTFNRRVGGKSYSEHLTGNAADVPRGFATVTQWLGYGARGVGVRYGDVVHVDMSDPPAGVFID